MKFLELKMPGDCALALHEELAAGVNGGGEHQAARYRLELVAGFGLAAATPDLTLDELELAITEMQLAVSDRRPA